jgi:HK97 family phage major capsid protein
MAHVVYDNFVLENKLEDLLLTKVNLQQYMTVDTSLTENAGMKKTIHTYTSTGDVEDLAMGVGNSQDIEVSFTPVDYVVKVTQGRFQYFDEQAMKDPEVIDAGLYGLATRMTNDFTTKAIAEFGKATLTYDASATGLTFDAIVDALAVLNAEDETGYFLLINVADKAALRKALGDDLKYVEDYARTGYIGSVAGCPVIVSKAVPAKTAFLANNEAVTLFIKKGSEIEQERDPNVRNNKVFARKVALVALTDATKVVKITTAS